MNKLVSLSINFWSIINSPISGKANNVKNLALEISFSNRKNKSTGAPVNKLFLIHVEKFSIVLNSNFISFSHYKSPILL